MHLIKSQTAHTAHRDIFKRFLLNRRRDSAIRDNASRRRSNREQENVVGHYAILANMLTYMCLQVGMYLCVHKEHISNVRNMCVQTRVNALKWSQKCQR